MLDEPAKFTSGIRFLAERVQQYSDRIKVGWHLEDAEEGYPKLRVRLRDFTLQADG